MVADIWRPILPPMQALNARDKRLAGLARAVRAAVIVPSLLSLTLIVIRNPEIVGFAVFGAFAHLVMVNYHAAGRARSSEAALLTLLGATLVGLGTLASANLWLAVGGAIAIGFLVELPVLTTGRIAVIRKSLLLSFMLGVAVPASVGSVVPHMAGWLLAGLVAQPVLLLSWIPLQSSLSAAEISGSHESTTPAVQPPAPSPWIGMAIATGAATLSGLFSASFRCSPRRDPKQHATFYGNKPEP